MGVENVPVAPRPPGIDRLMQPRRRVRSVRHVECPSCGNSDNLAVYAKPVEAMFGISSMDDSTVVASTTDIRMMNVPSETAEMNCNGCGHRWTPDGVTFDIQ